MAGAEVVQGPSRFQGELRDAGEVEAERDGEAGALVALAVAAGDAVDGEHHDLDAGLLGAGHHLAVQGAVFVEVELVDLRAVAEAAGFLEAGRAEGRDAEHGAEFAGGGRDGALAVMVEEGAAGAVGGAVERQG